MPKNKISGLSNILSEQAKERFSSSSSSAEESDAGGNNAQAELAESAEKVRKNFYIEKHLAKLLRKMAYEEETDQTKIVNAALAAYFKANGYE